ncbi:MAG: divalent-cation tolerance protein CutA [Pyrinomonadaceae bacterium]|nr:divalent-cation tolerance protein CutA [Pyrinomonadaceae bacterium]
MQIVLTTTSTEEEAFVLAEKLVGANLAACVQVLPAMTSVYAWQGKIHREREHLLLIKTLGERYEELEAFIAEHLSYDTPEIVAINSAAVSEKYRRWLVDWVQ